jgi:hypothetical protein
LVASSHTIATFTFSPNHPLYFPHFFTYPRWNGDSSAFTGSIFHVQSTQGSQVHTTQRMPQTNRLDAYDELGPVKCWPRMHLPP